MLIGLVGVVLVLQPDVWRLLSRHLEGFFRVREHCCELRLRYEFLTEVNY